MNLRNYINKVADFHEVMRYRQPEPRTPDLGDIATNKLRPELLREEIRETLEAIESGNRVETLDGLCDTQYVLSGAVLAWGFRELYLATVTTVELRKIHDVSAHCAAMLGITRQMESVASHLFTHQLLTHICEMQKRMNTLIWHCGFSPVFEEAFGVVHANNMGKLWSHEQWADFANPIGDGTLKFESVKGGYIARRADGKIIKPQGFAKVTLERFV